MKQTLAIARREIAAFFHSAMAPVVIIGFLALAGLFFTLFLLGYAESSLVAVRSGRGGFLNFTEGVFRPLVTDMIIFLLFLLPAVTMRLLSGELRSGRFDLIMSWPVPDRTWVLGKWLSAVAVAVVLIVASGFYFGVVSVLGKPEVGPVLVAALGLVLVSAAVSAWGLVFSALFPYQVVSYVLSFGSGIALFVMGALAPHLPGLMARIAQELALGDHFVRFSRGTIDSRDVVYYVGLTVVGLAAATAVLGGTKQPARRRLRGWWPTLVLLGVAIFAQIVAIRRPLAVDLTPNSRYSLAPQTVQVLDALDQPLPVPGTDRVAPVDNVEIRAFYQPLDPARSGMEVLLQSLSNRSSRVHYRMIDPESEPELVKQDRVAVARTVVVQVGDRRQGMLEPDEGQLINMIYRLATNTRPTVGYVLGHGEHLLDGTQRAGYSSVADLLAANGYQLRSLLLPDRLEVPRNFDLLIIAGPKLDFSSGELAALDAYLDRGGAMLVLCDPPTPESVRAWTQDYNVKLEGDVIVATREQSDLAGVGLRSAVVVDRGYTDHPIVESMHGVATVLPMAQSLHPVQASLPRISGQVFLLSEQGAWGDRDPDTKFSGKPIFQNGRDLLGPLPLAVALEIASADSTGSERVADGPRRDVPESQSMPDQINRAMRKRDLREQAGESLFGEQQSGRLVVVGNSEFISNANLDLYGNRDLLLNMVNWLVQEDVLINLRARRGSFQPLLLEHRRSVLIGWICALGWPLLVGGVSVGIVLRHRRRR